MANVTDSTGFVCLGLAVCDAPLESWAGHLVPQNPALGQGKQRGTGPQKHQTLSVPSPWSEGREGGMQRMTPRTSRSRDRDKAESSREGPTTGSSEGDGWN